MKILLLSSILFCVVRCSGFYEESENFRIQRTSWTQNINRQPYIPVIDLTSPNSFAVSNSQMTQSYEYPQQSSTFCQQEYPTMAYSYSSSTFSNYSSPQSFTNIPLQPQPSYPTTSNIEVNNSRVEFKYASLLQRALAVDLEEMFTSPNFDPESLAALEKDIFSSYSPKSGNMRWVLCFKKTLDKWNLFGAHGYTSVDPIIVFGLHRIIQASGFQLLSVVHDKYPICKYSWDVCISKIFEGIGVTYSTTSRDKLFQSLLWFYGNYRFEATRIEQDALKIKCAAETSLPSGPIEDSSKANTPQSSSSATGPQNKQTSPKHLFNRLKTSQKSAFQSVFTYTTKTISSTINNTESLTALDLVDIENHNSEVRASGKFKYGTLLKEALKVNLEEKLRKITSQDSRSFEYDIYSYYISNNGGIRKWSSIFDKTMNKWGLFGEHEYRAELLASNGLLRVIFASNFKLKCKALSLDSRIKKILRVTCQHKTTLKRDKIYQTLLWFFGRYKLVASKKELAAIKANCPAEHNPRKLPLNHNSSSIPISDESEGEVTSNTTAKTAGINTDLSSEASDDQTSHEASDDQTYHEASDDQSLFEEVLNDSTNTGSVSSVAAKQYLDIPQASSHTKPFNPPNSNVPTKNSKFQVPLVTSTTYGINRANVSAAHTSDSNTNLLIGSTSGQYHGVLEIPQQPLYPPVNTHTQQYSFNQQANYTVPQYYPTSSNYYADHNVQDTIYSIGMADAQFPDSYNYFSTAQIGDVTQNTNDQEQERRGEPPMKKRKIQHNFNFPQTKKEERLPGSSFEQPQFSFTLDDQSKQSSLNRNSQLDQNSTIRTFNVPDAPPILSSTNSAASNTKRTSTIQTFVVPDVIRTDNVIGTRNVKNTSIVQSFLVSEASSEPTLVSTGNYTETSNCQPNEINEPIFDPTTHIPQVPQQIDPANQAYSTSSFPIYNSTFESPTPPNINADTVLTNEEYLYNIHAVYNHLNSKRLNASEELFNNMHDTYKHIISKRSLNAVSSDGPNLTETHQVLNENNSLESAQRNTENGIGYTYPQHLFTPHIQNHAQMTVSSNYSFPDNIEYYNQNTTNSQYQTLIQQQNEVSEPLEYNYNDVHYF